MIAGLFVVTGREYAELCSHIGNMEEVARVNNHVDQMLEAIKQHGWMVNGSCVPTTILATR